MNRRERRQLRNEERRERRDERKTRRSFLCVDCGKDTFGGEYYMVWNWLWAKAGNVEGMLCFPCLEQRIGRHLVPADFTAISPNPDYWEAYVRQRPLPSPRLEPAHDFLHRLDECHHDITAYRQVIDDEYRQLIQRHVALVYAMHPDEWRQLEENGRTITMYRHDVDYWLVDWPTLVERANRSQFEEAEAAKC